MSSCGVSDYDSASSSDYDEEMEQADDLKKQNCHLAKQNQELKSLLCNALNRLQIANLSADEADFRLLNQNATTSHETFKESCDVVVKNLEKNCHNSSPSNSDDALCLLCCSEPREHAFMPCFHLIACQECAEKCEECPICRKNITDLLKIYLN